LPSLYEILDQLRFITRELAVLGLFLTGGLIVLVRDWRTSLLALLAQYLLAGFVLARLILPEVALIKVLVGALICPMLYLAARQAGWLADRGVFRVPDALANWVSPSRPHSWRRHAGQGMPMGTVPVPPREEDAWSDVFPAGLAFRLLAVTLMALLTVALSQTFPLPNIPPDVGLGSYWLILIGLLILMLTEAPLKAGQGLLTVIIGFELLYAPIERSLAMVWLWAVVNLLLTLAIAYLAVAHQDAGSPEGDL
jgi:hypothetical protein